MIRALSSLLALALVFAAAPAAAGGATTTIPSLRDSTTVDGEFVRLGDLIDNVGDAARTPVFRAPELGATGTIQVYRIIEAARTNGVSVFDTHGISEVLVSRASRTIPLSDIERAVAETAARQTDIGDANNIAVVLDSVVRPLAVEPNAAPMPRIVQFSYDPRTQRFDANLDIPGSNAIRRRGTRISGYLYETATIATLTHPVTHGDIIRDSDVQITRIAKAELAPDIVRNAGALVGFAARRDLRAGAPIHASELMKPELVSRGDVVTLRYESPGVMLTVRARAMDSGTEGDMIQVVNPQSKRTVEAVIEGPGRVVVRPMRTARATPAEITGSLK